MMLKSSDERGHPYFPPDFNGKSSNFSSLRQKQFNAPNPVREYTRFIPEQFANTGINPSNKLKEFMLKDVIHPIQRDRTHLYPNTTYNLQSRKNN